MEIVTKPHMFYVAMSNLAPGKGCASCVADDPDTVKEFFQDYATHEIAYVTGDDMQRLMTN